MAERDQRQGKQPEAEGGRGLNNIRQELGELDRIMAGVREHLERIRSSAPSELGAPGEGGEAEGVQTEQAGGAQQEQTGEQQKEQGERREEASAQPEQQAGAPEEPYASEQPPEEQANVEQAMQEPQAEEGEQPEGVEAEQSEELKEEAESKEAEKEVEEKETAVLFDGTSESMSAWKKVGAGEFELQEQELRIRSGRDRGLVYYTGRRFSDFRLRAQYRVDSPQAPMGAVVRFLDPEQPVPDREHPERKYRYDNQAYVAVHTGFEVRLSSKDENKVGTFTGIPLGEETGNQRHSQPAELKSQDWNELEIEVHGNDYTVRLNGAETARFINTDDWRGKPESSGPDAGYLGFLMGEEQPGAARRPGARPPPGPMLPGRIGGARPARGAGAHQEASGASLALRRVEVQTLRAAGPQVSEEKKKLARKDLSALHAEVIAALAKLKSKDQGLDGVLKKAYGYAVLPAVGRASLLLGGARGYGEVFEQGNPVGFTRITQVTFGVQVGGQTFTELILFGSKESLEGFKRSPLAFNGNLSAVFIRGASGTTDFKDVAAHAYSRGGMLLEASLGGQKYRFMREDEVIQELAKKRQRDERIANITRGMGRKAKGYTSKLSSKVSGFIKELKSE
jgi:lipid-binding SYLF domain-containing protein